MTKKNMKVILTILILGNTPVMAGGSALEGFSDLNIQSDIGTPLITHQEVKNEHLPNVKIGAKGNIILHLHKKLVMNCFLFLSVYDIALLGKIENKAFNQYFKASILPTIHHLDHTLNLDHLNDYFNDPGFKLPFYCAPKKINQIWPLPSFCVTLSTLPPHDSFGASHNKRISIACAIMNHSRTNSQDKKIFLSRVLSSTPHRVAPIIDILLNSLHTKQERRDFIEKNQFDHEVIMLLGRWPHIMKDLGVDLEIQKMITRRCDFLYQILDNVDGNVICNRFSLVRSEDLKKYIPNAPTPESAFSLINSQKGIDFQMIGYAFLCTYQYFSIKEYLQASHQEEAVIALGKLAKETAFEFSDYAEKTCFSIAKDPNYLPSLRFKMIDILKNFGEKCKSSIPKICLSILENTIDPHYKMKVADILKEFEDKYYVDKAVNIYLSIAKDPNVKEKYRRQAIRALEDYRQNFIEACFFSATDKDTSALLRWDCAKALKNTLGGHHQSFVEACLSILWDNNLENLEDCSIRLDAAKALVEFGGEQSSVGKEIGTQLSLSIITLSKKSMLDIDTSFAINALVDFGQAERIEVKEECLNIATNKYRNFNSRLHAAGILFQFKKMYKKEAIEAYESIYKDATSLTSGGDEIAKTAQDALDKLKNSRRLSKFLTLFKQNQKADT